MTSVALLTQGHNSVSFDAAIDNAFYNESVISPVYASVSEDFKHQKKKKRSVITDKVRRAGLA